MPSSTKSPGTLASDNAYGTVAWGNPTNAGASDDSRAIATTVTPANKSQYLKATNFGFAASGRPKTLAVSIERQASSGGVISDDVLKLVVGGVVQSTDLADTVTKWGITDETITYTFDVSALTAAQVNASDFGVVLAARAAGSSADARVDHIQATLTWQDEGLEARGWL